MTAVHARAQLRPDPGAILVDMGGPPVLFVRQVPEPPTAWEYPIITGWTVPRLLRLERMWAAGWNTRDIGADLRTSAERVCRAAKKAGITARWPRGSSGSPRHEPYPINAPWPPPARAMRVFPTLEAERAKNLAACLAGMRAAREDGKRLGRTPKVDARTRGRALLLVAFGKVGGAKALRSALGLCKPTFHAAFPGGFGALCIEARRAFGSLPCTVCWSDAKASRAFLPVALRAGVSFADLAAILGAPTWQAVRSAAIEEGACAKDADGNWVAPTDPLAVSMPGHKLKRRRCLRCRDEFVSEGPHQHMCPKCRKNVAGAYDPWV